MKQTRSSIENRLKRAVESETPDVWQGILQRIETDSANVIPKAEAEPIQFKKRNPMRKWVNVASGIAAMLLIMFGYWGYMNRLPLSTVAFDVNPSVELVINRSERVIAATPLNDDALLILDGMDLRNTEIKVAVNALIGSMVKNGFISEANNSILISVDSKDSARGQELRQWLTEEINILLGGQYSVDGAILSQTISQDDRLRLMAEEHGISLGKAALIDLLVTGDPTLDFGGLATLSINDINLLIASRSTGMSGVESQGAANDSRYIDVDEVKQTVYLHAGVSQSDVTAIEVELDYEHGRMLYEVEFECYGYEYEYVLDARTGEIVEYEHEDGAGHVSDGALLPNDADAGHIPEEGQSGGENQYIGGEAAIAIALAHAGVTQDSAEKLECKLDEDDDKMIYEIEFTFGGKKYECDIDAYSGSILKWEADDK